MPVMGRRCAEAVTTVSTLQAAVFGPGRVRPLS
jgi:hypothetical protein